ncbi:hypothetical protein D3C72_1534570 [compost metagenome]
MWNWNCIWLLLPTRKAGMPTRCAADAVVPDSSGTLTTLWSSVLASGRRRYERTSWSLMSMLRTESL